jgi:hypothetical protein
VAIGEEVQGEFGRLMEGGEGKITVPIPVFLIEHRHGRRPGYL